MVVNTIGQSDAVTLTIHFHFTHYCQVTMTQRNFDSTFTQPVPGVGVDTIAILAVRRA
jgi:hypothetical protein